MAVLTDPAREFSELCERLSQPGNAKLRGDEHLARLFGVDAWSTEFYQIIFSVQERADFLAEVISGLAMDDDLKDQAVAHLRQLKLAFSKDGLNNPWTSDHHGPRHLGAQHYQAIKMLSTTVRAQVSYPKLDAAEIDELVSILGELEAWLTEHQLKEQDFIRQAILDGISQFRFRLERIGWLGWGYTVESLREVVGAYIALERGFPLDQASPDATAVAKKVGATLKKVYEKTVFLKEASETADFVLRLYGATTIAVQGVSGIAGLLAGPS